MECITVGYESVRLKMKIYFIHREGEEPDGSNINYGKNTKELY
jgi:hypothetical protein